MTITMIPLRHTVSGGHDGIARGDVFVRRRLVVGACLAAVFLIVGFAARPHLAAPDARPASLVGSSQINVGAEPAAGGPTPMRGSDYGIDASGTADLNEAAVVAADAAVVPDAVVVADAAVVDATIFYMVQPGDSLWSVAAERVPASQVDAYLSKLIALNGSSALMAGQRLILPN